MVVSGGEWWRRGGGGWVRDRRLAGAGVAQQRKVQRSLFTLLLEQALLRKHARCEADGERLDRLLAAQLENCVERGVALTLGVAVGAPLLLRALLARWAGRRTGLGRRAQPGLCREGALRPVLS